MTDLPAPAPTGRPAQEISLTGKLFAWQTGQPVLVSMPGSDRLYLPCFSTEEQLRRTLARSDVPFESLKRIDDGHEFFSSVPSEITVVLDLRYLPNGRARFLECKRG